MADFLTEKFFLPVSPRSLQSDGTKFGKITLSTTEHLYVKRDVVLKSNTAGPEVFEVKRVISPTELILGPPNSSIAKRSDVSNYLVADGATLKAHEQARPAIPYQEHENAVYANEPVVAKRTVSVDKFGNFYDTKNPLPVQLTDGNVNIGTVNNELEVQLEHRDNHPDSGDEHDSVRIGDGEDQLEINGDGSINIDDKSTAITPGISIFSITNADTEVSTSLPQGTKFIRIKVREHKAVLRLSYSSGGTSSNYVTIPRGSVYEKSDINTQSSIPIYFQVDRSNQVLEIETWQ